MSRMLRFNHFYTRKMAINMFCCTQIINLIKFSIQNQFGVFLRGHVGTGGKPSTWFPPGDSQSKATPRRTTLLSAGWLTALLLLAAAGC